MTSLAGVKIFHHYMNSSCENWSHEAFQAASRCSEVQTTSKLSATASQPSSLNGAPRKSEATWENCNKPHTGFHRWTRCAKQLIKHWLKCLGFFPELGSVTFFGSEKPTKSVIKTNKQLKSFSRLLSCPAHLFPHSHLSYHMEIRELFKNS